jgi:undecaprenyl-diphosphatase
MAQGPDLPTGLPLSPPLDTRQHVMVMRRRHALALGSALLAAAALLTLAVSVDPFRSWVQRVDDRWLEWMVELRTPWMTRLCTALSTIGGPMVTVPVRLLVIVLLAYRRHWLRLGAFLGAVICSELCIGPLKALVDRPRPPASLVETTSASFPSGHAIAGAVTAFGLVLVVLPSSPRRLWAIAVAAAFSGLMALSRTYLAAHWLTDTLAGACIGTGLALVWAAGLELARDRYRSAGRQAHRQPRRQPSNPTVPFPPWPTGAPSGRRRSPTPEVPP